jgi:hemerythrin
MTNETDSIVVWSETWSVGDDRLDRQHRRIIDTANVLLGFQEDVDSKIAFAAIEEAMEYAIMHFDDEEKILSDAGFHDIVAHKGKHSALRSEILRLAEKGGDVRLSEAQSLMRAIISHITGSDRAYVGLISG